MWLLRVEVTHLLKDFKEVTEAKEEFSDQIAERYDELSETSAHQSEEELYQEACEEFSDQIEDHFMELLEERRSELEEEIETDIRNLFEEDILAAIRARQAK
jgi:hypothetical protein